MKAVIFLFAFTLIVALINPINGKPVAFANPNAEAVAEANPEAIAEATAEAVPMPIALAEPVAGKEKDKVLKTARDLCLAILDYGKHKIEKHLFKNVKCSI